MATFLTDDFESGSYARWTNSAQLARASANVASDRAYAGTYASKAYKWAGDDGYAQVRVDHATGGGLGTYHHFGFRLWFNGDEDPAVNVALGITASIVQIAELRNTAGNITFNMRFHNSAGTAYSKQFGVRMYGGAGVNYYDAAGIPRRTWHEVHVYTYLHNSAGHVQVWVNGNKRLEGNNIDTYVATATRAVIGIVAAPGSVDFGCFWIDDFTWDNATSPFPPGTESVPLSRKILSPALYADLCARGAPS